MPVAMPFAEVLEIVDRLTLDEQNSLMAIVNRRLAEKRRQAIVDDVREASEDYRTGKCQPTTPEQLLKDVLS